MLSSGVSSAGRFVLEAEDAHLRSNGGHAMNIVHRSEASNAKSVSARKGDSFYFEFCLSSASKIRIDDVRYSNDGHSDTFVLLNVDGKHIAKIETVSRFLGGAGWNAFISLNKPLDYFISSKGKHSLILKVLEADQFGVEIDNIVLSVDKESDVDFFKCKMYCYDTEIKLKNSSNGLHRFPTAWIEQRSTETKCAEEDNVNVPIYGENVKAFTITAALPNYKSYMNNRNPDFTDCTMLTALWSFENIVFENEKHPERQYHKSSIGPKHTKHQDGDVAALIAGFNSKRMVVDILFKMEGKEKGVVDADIGSILHLTLRNVKRDVYIVMQYRGRTGEWSVDDVKKITVNQPHQTWNIPDFTWLENGENHVKVEIYSWERHAEIEKIELMRRHTKSTRIFHMYSDQNHLVEGADIDFWWLINKTMTIRVLDTGKIFHDADYIRIYNRIPWTKDNFAQNFVIYQDGNIRLLPFAPREFDWIPFGSSVLIGQIEPSHHRPFASIKQIDILVQNLKLWIYFEDGGSLALNIIPNLNHTIIEVSDVNFVKDKRKHPFLTFRSMWVANGNADVDQVIVDGQTDKHIMSNWHKIDGASFEFYRKCISKHNTQSPDILVDVKP